MNIKQKELFLFTDGSVDPQSGIGIGAYLLISKDQFTSTELENKIKLQQFDNTSSSKLEIETLLWALGHKNIEENKIVIYTDCQNIIGLEKRRENLVSNEYKNAQGKLLNNHLLYKQFYKNIDILDIKFVKVKGHIKNSLKNEIDKIFALVDKASRRTLRDIL